MESIGKVKIDYSFYNEKEDTSKIEYEDNLLKIARDCSKLEYPQIIEDKASWFYMYHLSPIRENIVRWLPINKNHKVLEIGAQCGEISGALAQMAGSLVSVEKSKAQCQINANRNSDMDNLTIYAGNIENILKTLDKDFDFVILAGSLEGAGELLSCEKPEKKLIELAKENLKPEGRMVIALDNRLGLKYFAGNKEINSGKWFGGIEGFSSDSRVKTYSKKVLESLLAECGIKNYNFYYPYPDYRLMTTIFSDKRLPKQGELVDNGRNFDNDRMMLFDESLAYDQIIADGIFDLYSNSYLVITGPDVDVEFARFSNDRINDYAIETSISNINGFRVVKKQALFLQGDKHILMMKEYENALLEKYQGSKLKINKCNIEYQDERPIACFEFVKGQTLGEIMNDLVEKGDNEGFMKLFREYLSRISYNENFPVTDKDVVFANIIVDGDDWTLIDYEWTVKKVIPVKEIAFRSIYCFLLEHKNANKLNLDLILQELELSQEAADDIRYDEVRFQKQITGNRKSLGELSELMGHKKFIPSKLIANYSDNEAFYKFQVYRPVEGAFSEEASFFYENAYINENEAVVDIDLSADEKIVRLDPLMDSCMIIVKECTYNGVAFPVADKKSLLVNGKRIDGNSFVFATNDPNMEFVLERLPKQAMNKLHVEMEILRMSQDAANRIAANIKRIF